MNGRGTCIFICPAFTLSTQLSCTTIFKEKTDIFLTIPIFSSRHIMSAGKTFATGVFVSVHVLNLIDSY